MIQVGSSIIAGSATQPSVTLTGARSAIPDEVAIFRDGTRIARVDGVDVFTGTDFKWIDWSCPPDGQPHTYRVAPIVNGKTAKGGPTIDVALTCFDTWLIDAEDDNTQDPARAVMTSTDSDLTQSDTEISITHEPITGTSPHVVRRRLVRLPASGAVSGKLDPKTGLLAISGHATLATLRTFADNDAGHLYRLVQRGQNLLVTIGDMSFDDKVHFNWWAR